MITCWIKTSIYSQNEKINALDLAGATMLWVAPYALSPEAFEYWLRAHQLREAAGLSAEKKLGRKIGSNEEWTTSAQLDRLEQQHLE